MFAIKRVTIAQHERGLVFRNRSFETILEPGVYRIFDPLKRTEVQVYDLTVPEFEHPRVDFLVKEARETIAKYFTIAEMSDREAGVVLKNGKVSASSHRASGSCTGAARSKSASSVRTS